MTGEQGTGNSETKVTTLNQDLTKENGEGIVNSRRQRSRGMTLVELMIAVALSIIVVGGIMAAYVQGLIIAQQEQIHNELQLNMELAMEHLRSDLRLSSVGISMMSFYPTNSSKFTAISLPRSIGTDGLVQVDTNGEVVWNQTIVYHVQPGSPDRLMRTVFEPRYTNAASELYAQLSRVAVATTLADFQAARLPFGSPTESVSTNVVFANLVDIEFISGDTNMTYDCYSPTKEEGIHTCCKSCYPRDYRHGILGTSYQSALLLLKNRVARRRKRVKFPC